MFSTNDQTVIIHIPVNPVTIRHGGVDKKVFDVNAGFSYAEYADSNIFPVTCPFQTWLMSIINQDAAGAVLPHQNIYFVFDPPGENPNPGASDSLRSLTDDTGAFVD